MSRRRPPVYWKPKYPTRVMRERAFAKRSLERERLLAVGRGPSLLAQVRAWFARRRL